MIRLILLVGEGHQFPTPSVFSLRFYNLLRVHGGSELIVIAFPPTYVIEKYIGVSKSYPRAKHEVTSFKVE